jgi:hypothetical protein
MVTLRFKRPKKEPEDGGAVPEDAGAVPEDGGAEGDE